MRAIRNEDGSASIEFITAGLLLMIPALYLVLTTSTIQMATLALEGGNRHAARVFSTAPSESLAFARARSAITLALADASIDERATTTIRCHPVPSDCLAAGSRVSVTTTLRLPLPFVPDFASVTENARVVLSATSVAVISRFHGASQ